MVVGNSGSGKTTLARALATHMSCDHVELDSLFHRPGWTQATTEEFRSALAPRIKADHWVVCGNYMSKVADMTWPRADTMVVFDFPRRVVMWRVTKRTIRRFLRREVLWNGNREPFRNFIALHDPERSIIRWAWSNHRMYSEAYRNASTLPHLQHLDWTFLRSPRDVDAFLARATR